MLAASGANTDDFPTQLLEETTKVDVNNINDQEVSGLQTMHERGDKLKAIDKTSIDIVQDARDFKEMANELKRKQKAKANWSMLSKVKFTK